MQKVSTAYNEIAVIYLGNDILILLGFFKCSTDA